MASAPCLPRSQHQHRMGTRQKGHQGWGEEEQRGGEQTFLARRTRLSCLVSLQHLAAFLSSAKEGALCLQEALGSSAMCIVSVYYYPEKQPCSENHTSRTRSMQGGSEQFQLPTPLPAALTSSVELSYILQPKGALSFFPAEQNSSAPFQGRLTVRLPRYKGSLTALWCNLGRHSVTWLGCA